MRGHEKLDRKALVTIKQKPRPDQRPYNDVERRILSTSPKTTTPHTFLLPDTPVLFGYLLKDGIIYGIPGAETLDAVHGTAADGRTFHLTRGYALTEDGHQLVRSLRQNIDLL